MKPARLLLPVMILLSVISCGPGERSLPGLFSGKAAGLKGIPLPVDPGFSEYITGYTSGTVSVNSPFEIRFTPEFVAETGRQKLPPGLFTFEPYIKGKAEWDGETTIVFRPDKILNPGTVYTGRFDLSRLAEVPEKLKSFPIRIQTIRRDFIVLTGIAECSDDGMSYTLHGELAASDYIPSQRVEACLKAKYGREKKPVFWDHSEIMLHKFMIPDIQRTDRSQTLVLEWDGSPAGVRQRGTEMVRIPAPGEFIVMKSIKGSDETQRIDIVFSDPVDARQETEGLVRFDPGHDITTSIRKNVLSVFPAERIEGTAGLIVEKEIRNADGDQLEVMYREQISFSPLKPAIELTGKGVIVPTSKNLVLPFRAASLKAFDLRIIKIFENNLPQFFQENEINTSYSVKRFGRPVYSGRIDLVNIPGRSTGSWNLYTVDLSEYINVEPGVLYKAELSIRPSYSLYDCSGPVDMSRYDEYLRMKEESEHAYWDDPYNFYYDSDEFIYYSFGFDWRERDDPCKEAYYSPDKRVSRNILASNLGIIAKKGADDVLRVTVNDLLSAQPLSEAEIEVFDFQLQKIASGETDKRGNASVRCDRKPFLLTAKKDRDRNYLKLTDGSSLSLSSFDVSGSRAENGINAFIYGERDVWRPGDSIFLSLLVRDISGRLPSGHPVQFELVNPLGQKIAHQVQIPGKSGLTVFRTATLPDAVTGNYQGIFRIGGATFTKRVRIETIKPNRLKIDLSFPGGFSDPGRPVINGLLSVRWLNGATASNLRSAVECLFRHTKTEFDRYKQYVFDDPATDFYSESVRIFEGTTDQNGEATVVFEPGRDIKAPGMLNVLFTTTVSEKGGDESITQSTFRYAPYPVFTGIRLPGLKENDRMLFTDRDNEVSVVTVDPSGKPVSSGVELNIYKISYQWWWESDRENLASYISNSIYKPVVSREIPTVNGEGSFTFRIPRNEWGRYLIRATDRNGHSTGRVVMIDWPWEYGMKGNAEGATLLAVSTDKEKYAPGDEISLTFAAPENSRAIITLENSASVIDEIRTGTLKGNNTVKFRAKPEMAPNVYAYVTVIQPHAQTINDMPMRLYGIVPVMVEDPASRLKPVITVPSEVRSQESFEVSVSEAGKKAMTYTLAIVDEGLLDITGYKTPDPWDHFYSKQALGVQTWDLYDFVLGAFGGTLDRIFATGGDEALIDRAANKAQRFTPVVKFLGPFTLPAGRTAAHTIRLPHYTGSVKTMVIAGEGMAFGSAAKTTVVRDPLMILATAPRVISPGEKVALPVTLFIQKESIRNVVVKAEGNDMVNFSENHLTVSADAGIEKDVEFIFTTAEKTGTAAMKITATGGGENAVYEIVAEVRNPNPPETRADMRILAPGEKWETSFTSFGTQNSASLEVSALPSVNLEKRIDYLLEYPHGCTEQIISAAFPQLWLGDISGNPASINERAAANIKKAVAMIISRQMNDGGTALWPGSYQPDEWVTSYAGHFIAEAERKGYNIPSGYRQKWISYQKKRAQTWRFDRAFRHSANNQAYRLFTLALAGESERGAMNRLRESEGIPQVTKWLLAAAYALTGRTEVADELLDMRYTATENEFAGYYYGSELRDKAIVLYTLSVLKKDEEGLPLYRSLCNDLSAGGWYSTQTTAWALMAYMKFTEMLPGDDYGEAGVKVSFNSETSEQYAGSKQVAAKTLTVRDGTNTMIAENISGRPLYVTLTRKGIPDPADRSYESRGLGMNVSYYTAGLQPVDVSALPQGTGFIMVVEVSNNTYQAVDNIALTQLVPSGWEIRNTRLFEAEYRIKDSDFDYRDFRDDRIYTYFSLGRGETKTFVAMLNAAYKGEFFQPPVWCEAMYTENCYARVPGNIVRVIPESFE